MRYVRHRAEDCDQSSSVVQCLLEVPAWQGEIVAWRMPGLWGTPSAFQCARPDLRQMPRGSGTNRFG